MIYAVQEKNTPWSITKKSNLTLSEVKTWNHLNQADQIHPEDRLKLRRDERD
jgi:LysM repeat protein